LFDPPHFDGVLFGAGDPAETLHGEHVEALRRKSESNLDVDPRPPIAQLARYLSWCGERQPKLPPEIKANDTEENPTTSRGQHSAQNPHAALTI
jgi:hypothetical protein